MRIPTWVRVVVVPVLTALGLWLGKSAADDLISQSEIFSFLLDALALGAMFNVTAPKDKKEE